MGAAPEPEAPPGRVNVHDYRVRLSAIPRRRPPAHLDPRSAPPAGRAGARTQELGQGTARILVELAEHRMAIYERDRGRVKQREACALTSISSAPLDPKRKGGGNEETGLVFDG